MSGATLLRPSKDVVNRLSKTKSVEVQGLQDALIELFQYIYPDTVLQFGQLIAFGPSLTQAFNTLFPADLETEWLIIATGLLVTVNADVNDQFIVFWQQGGSSIRLSTMLLSAFAPVG